MKSYEAHSSAQDSLSSPDISQETIGEIIRRKKTLSDDQVEQVLLYQRKHGIRFGEAAVALNLATQNDVMSALSVQFDYPHTSFLNRSPELVSAASPFSDQAEIFRDLRSQLMMGVMAPDHARCALAVVSPNHGDGRSYVAANLAITFSQLGGNTLLVDADLRSPRLHTLMGVKPTSGGLANMLLGRLGGGDVICSVDGLPSLFLLPAGTVPPNPLELIQRSSFGLLLHELLARFDHVIVDSPSVSVGADARVIAAKCGSALVLGRRSTTSMKSMQKLVAALDRGPAEVAGIVINERAR